MDLAHVFVFLWMFFPALLVSLVWWSWAKERGEDEGWRQSATFLSAAATTVNLALMLAVVIWGYLQAEKQGLDFSVVLLAFALCMMSIISAIIGKGLFRLLIIPAAILQGFGWLVALFVLHEPVGSM
jgi:ATP/ADP translocase